MLTGNQVQIRLQQGIGLVPENLKGDGSLIQNQGESSNRRQFAKDECAYCHLKGH